MKRYARHSMKRKTYNGYPVFKNKNPNHNIKMDVAYVSLLSIIN